MSKLKLNLNRYFSKGSDRTAFYYIYHIAISVLALLIGIFFIVYNANRLPLPREDMTEYSGLLDSVTCWKDGGTVYLSDGTSFPVSAASADLLQELKQLEAGTSVRLLVDSRSGEVMEITVGADEWLSYQTAKKSLSFDAIAFIVMGALAIFAGVTVPIVLCLEKKQQQEGKARIRVAATAGESVPLRRAETEIKFRVLAETTATHHGWIYRICYRRVKHTNELVINGDVYDEKKGIVEFSHILCANLNGDLIEVGFDDSTEFPHSFIRLNGKTLVKKKRII